MSTGIGTIKVDCPTCGNVVPVVIEGWAEHWGEKDDQWVIECRPSWVHICPGPPSHDGEPVEVAA